MKIAIAYDLAHPYTLGGGERRFHFLARELVRRGHEVTYLTMRYEPSHDTEFVDGIRYLGLGLPVSLESVGRRTILGVLQYSFALFRHCSRTNYDIVDVCNFPYLPAFVVGLLLRGFRRRPCIVTWLEYTGDYWLRLLPKPLAIAARVFENIVLRIGVPACAISHFTARRMKSVGGYTGRVDVVSGGLEVVRETTVSANHVEPATFAVVGRLQPHKRVGLILRSLSALRASGVPVRVQIFGDGAELASLRILANDLSVSDIVTFFPRASDYEIASALARSRGLILASEREGLCMVVLEALSVGVPVIVCESEFSAATELVRPEWNGFVVASTTHGIAAGIRQILEVPAEEWRERCWNSVRGFTYAIAAEELERVYASSLREASS